MKRLYFINPKGSHQSRWSLKTITIVSENKRRPLISSESQCFLENGKESASKTHHCILSPETAGSHARTTRASIDLLRSILRNRIRAAVSYIIARVVCVSRSRRNSFNHSPFRNGGNIRSFHEKREEEKFLSCLIIIRFYEERRGEERRNRTV